MKSCWPNSSVCWPGLFLVASMMGLGCGALAPCDPLFEACPIEDAGLFNPVFPDAELVTLGSPNLCVVNRTPTFTWESTGQRLVFAGIFSRNVTIVRQSIGNTVDNVWAWHTGLGTGREGNVAFGDGVAVIDGEVVVGSAAAPLVQGRAYVWVVWAWDFIGRKITHSSPEAFFTVDSAASATCTSPLGGQSIVVVRARWIDGNDLPVAIASVGDTLRLQICSIGPLRRFTGVLALDPRLSRIDAADFVSSRGTGVHPDCVALVDRTVVSSATGQVFRTTASNASVGPAGLIEVTLEAILPGLGTPLLSVIEAEVFLLIPPVVEVDFSLVEIR